MTKKIIIGIGFSLALILVLLFSSSGFLNFFKGIQKEAATKLPSSLSEPPDPLNGYDGKPDTASTSGTHPNQLNAKKISNMAWIPGGEFIMGSTDKINDENDHPEHKVILNGFYMDTTEVTQGEYARVMGENPSLFKGCPDCPVENVTWSDAMAYCRKIGKRLPTEAEWEFACRAGSAKKNYWGDKKSDGYAWYWDNSEQKTHPVGQKTPNGFGLYDMMGNVWEWCSDWFDTTYYGKSPRYNPQGPDSGTHRVFRGGSWINDDAILHCALRDGGIPDRRDNLMGFRCVCSREKRNPPLKGDF